MKICKKGHKYKVTYPKTRAGCLKCRKVYMKIYCKIWGKNNVEKKRLSNKKWRLKHKEYNKKRLAKYQKEKSEMYAFNTAKRRKLVKERTPIWLTESDWIEIKWAYKIAKEMTLETGIKYEVDHIIPLKGKNISGLHCPQNLQVIKEFDNISKLNRYQNG